MQCSAGHPSTEMIPLHGPARRYRPSFSCPVCRRTVDFFGTVIEEGVLEQEVQEYDIKAEDVGSDSPCVARADGPPDPGEFASHVPECGNGHPHLPMTLVEQPMSSARWFRCPRCSERRLLVSMALLDESTGKNWLWQNLDQNRRLVQQRAMESESINAGTQIRVSRDLPGRLPASGRRSATEEIAAERDEIGGPSAAPPPEQVRPVDRSRFLHLLVGSIGLFVLVVLWSLSMHPGGNPVLPLLYGALFVIGAVAHLWYGREVADDLSGRQSKWLLAAGVLFALACWFVPEVRVAFLGDLRGMVLWDYIPRVVGGVFFVFSGMTGLLSRAW